jgi:hypothetical protein
VTFQLTLKAYSKCSKENLNLINFCDFDNIHGLMNHAVGRDPRNSPVQWISNVLSRVWSLGVSKGSLGQPYNTIRAGSKVDRLSLFLPSQQSCFLLMYMLTFSKVLWEDFRS